MSNVCIITGSSGLVGSESVEFFSGKSYRILGIDNNMREKFFGTTASTDWNTRRLMQTVPGFEHHPVDIRDLATLNKIFAVHNSDIKLIIHAAAQPSHDWAYQDPVTDFTINANGTLNLLEMTRKYCPKATFIFTSTNKVYGDTPNFLPLVETETRWEIDETHPYFKNGIDEKMSIDDTRHSLFGASKVAADVLVQEYGRCFDMHTGVFRGGCLTGPNHSGTQLHGFLSYLVKCALTGEKYTIFGYKGKQVRDNIHSMDLVKMFWHFHKAPGKGVVYNAGGGRFSNCSVTEAIDICEHIIGKKMHLSYSDSNRPGDHIWWISDVSKFKRDYPDWDWKYNIHAIIEQIINTMSKRL